MQIGFYTDDWQCLFAVDGKDRLRPDSDLRFEVHHSTFRRWKRAQKSWARAQEEMKKAAMTGVSR